MTKVSNTVHRGNQSNCFCDGTRIDNMIFQLIVENPVKLKRLTLSQNEIVCFQQRLVPAMLNATKLTYFL